MGVCVPGCCSACVWLVPSSLLVSFVSFFFASSLLLLSLLRRRVSLSHASVPSASSSFHLLLAVAPTLIHELASRHVSFHSLQWFNLAHTYLPRPSPPLSHFSLRFVNPVNSDYLPSYNFQCEFMRGEDEIKETTTETGMAHSLYLTWEKSSPFPLIIPNDGWKDDWRQRREEWDTPASISITINMHPIKAFANLLQGASKLWLIVIMNNGEAHILDFI